MELTFICKLLVPDFCTWAWHTYNRQHNWGRLLCKDTLLFLSSVHIALDKNSVLFHFLFPEEERNNSSTLAEYIFSTVCTGIWNVWSR